MITSHNCSACLAYREERGRRGPLECRLPRRHQEVQQLSPLLPTGGDHGQEPLGKAAASFAIRPKAAFAPQYRWSQSALCPIVGWLHALYSREGPEGRPPLA